MKDGRRLTSACGRRLFRERLNQVKVKLDEVLTGKAGEYREPLAALQNSMQIRTQVAGKHFKELQPFTDGITHG